MHASAGQAVSRPRRDRGTTMNDQTTPTTPAPAAADAQPFAIQQTPTNTIGTIGFIFSLLGLVACGLPSLIGLLLCYFGIKRTPNKLAKAGLVISILGIATYILLFATGAVPIFGKIFKAVTGGPSGAVAVQLEAVASEVDAYTAKAGSLPGSLEQATKPGSSLLTDPWGNAIRYEINFDGKTYTLTSNGPDGVASTGDDVKWPEAKKPE